MRFCLWARVLLDLSLPGDRKLYECARIPAASWCACLLRLLWTSHALFYAILSFLLMVLTGTQDRDFASGTEFSDLTDFSDSSYLAGQAPFLTLPISPRKCLSEAEGWSIHPIA